MKHILLAVLACVGCEHSHVLKVAWDGHIPDSLLYVPDSVEVRLQYNRPDSITWSGMYLVYQSMNYEADYLLYGPIDTVGLLRNISAYIICNSHSGPDTTWILSPKDSLYVFP